MATITITIPDEKVNQVLEAFAIRYRYDPNAGQTKAEFAKSKIIDYLKREYIEFMAEQTMNNIKNNLDDIV